MSLFFSQIISVVLLVISIFLLIKLANKPWLNMLPSVVSFFGAAYSLDGLWVSVVSWLLAMAGLFITLASFFGGLLFSILATFNKKNS